MPQSYRFEISANNRAGCQNKACKDVGLKITKGELRFGTWVEFSFGDREVQSWKWRHWGCITPTVIQNLLSALGGLEGIEEDLNVIDGYDEIPQEWQAKVLTMLREGHVPDEDWKGDVEQNRPGNRGSHKKAKSSKKKAENESGDENAEGTPTKPKAAKRRSKKTTAEVDGENNRGDDVGETPVKAKASKGRGKKVKTEVNNDDESDDGEKATVKAKASKARGKKVKVEADGEDEDPVAAAASKEKSLAPKKRKAGHLALMEVDNDVDSVPNEKPTKRSRAKKPKVEQMPENDRVEDKPPAKKGRPKKSVKVEDIGEDNGAVVDASAGSKAAVGGARGSKEEPKQIARRGRPKSVPKVENRDEEQVDMADVPIEGEPELVAAADSGEDNKTKTKAGRKKGLAKTIPKGRTRHD